MAAKIIIVAIFLAVTVAVGLIFRRRADTVNGFVLGGRSVGPWLTAFAYGTSYFSAVIFVGYAGQFGWDNGISAVWIGIGNALIGSLAAWVVLARRTRIMTKHFEAATMPEFFAKRYDSKALKLAASLIIFIFLIPYSASVYKGLSGLFSMSFGIDFKWCILGMALITGIYVVLGGYVATAVNDCIQGVVMLVGMVAVVGAVVTGKGSFTETLSALSQVECETAPGLSGAFTSFFGPRPLTLLSVVLLTSFGPWGLPQMVHKFYAIKDEKAIKTGTVISTVFALIVGGGAYFMGGYGRLFYAAGEGGFDYNAIIPTMLGSVLPDVLIGVVLVLVLCASMSTLSSLVITSSSTFVLDFLKPNFCKNMKDKTQMLFVRIFCAVFVVISVVIALWSGALITTLMSLAWGALSGAFLGPYLYGLFFKKATRASVWASFIVGVGIMVANLVFPFTDSSSAATVAGGIAILSSFVVVPVVSLFTPKLPKEHVDAAFSCYDIKVEAPSRSVLVDNGDHDSFKPKTW